MAESFGDECSRSRMVATLALMDVFEDCLALLWLHTALVNTSDTTPYELSIDDGVRCHLTLYLPSRDLIGWQLFIHHEFEDGLGP